MATIFDIAQICKSLSVSMLPEQQILREFYRVPPARRKHLHKAVSECIKGPVPFDVAQPLLIVDIHCLAAKTAINPAVLLMIYFFEEKTKITRIDSYISSLRIMIEAIFPGIAAITLCFSLYGIEEKRLSLISGALFFNISIG